jgi:hypothetical protein
MEYSALVGNHGHLVYRKWIRHQDVGTQDILDAPGLGPTVAISSIYEAVARMRFAPIGKASVIPIAAASLFAAVARVRHRNTDQTTAGFTGQDAHLRGTRIRS